MSLDSQSTHEDSHAETTAATSAASHDSSPASVLHKSKEIQDATQFPVGSGRKAVKVVKARKNKRKDHGKSPSPEPPDSGGIKAFRRFRLLRAASHKDLEPVQDDSRLRLLSYQLWFQQTLDKHAMADTSAPWSVDSKGKPVEAPHGPAVSSLPLIVFKFRLEDVKSWELPEIPEGTVAALTIDGHVLTHIPHSESRGSAILKSCDIARPWVPSLGLLNESCMVKLQVVDDFGYVTNNVLDKFSFKPVVHSYVFRSCGGRVALYSDGNHQDCCGTVTALHEDGSLMVQVDNASGGQREHVVKVKPDFSHIAVARTFQYAAGELLLYLHEDSLVDATVEPSLPTQPGDTNRHHLLVAGETRTVQLNELNHAKQRFADANAYRQTRLSYIQRTVEESRFVEDAITGNRLAVEEQLVPISTDATSSQTQDKQQVMGLQLPQWASVRDVRGFVPLLLKATSRRQQGGIESQPVLIRAGPGTGKTWALQSLLHLLAKNADPGLPVPWVPAILHVQRLARIMRSNPISQGAGVDLVLLYFRAVAEDGQITEDELKVLEMAYDMRALVLLIDGIDEASNLSRNIEDFVLEMLVPMGVRFVVTSRPEGVRLEKYAKHFVIMNLLPLTEEQQNDAIAKQMRGNSFFQHIQALVKIRTEHDRIYERSAFPDAKDRQYLEHFKAPNKFCRPDGSFDPDKRQRTVDGSRFIAPWTAEPRSATLKDCSAIFTPELLNRFDAVLKELPPEATKADIVTGLELSKIPNKKQVDLATKFALFAHKSLQKDLGNTSAALWQDIAARTDELFIVAERNKPVFDTVSKALCSKAGLNPDQDLVIGPLKDPIRIYEKATDDYGTRFSDGVIAEANVVDVVRARLVAGDGPALRRMMEHLLAGFETEVDGHVARLELVRCKNKFAKLDPTHFRNILNNLSLEYNGSNLFVEMQVHQKLILDYNEESHAHDHYDFFRAKLQNKYEEALGSQLEFFIERQISFYESICGVPVLLSMMILVLSASQDTDSTVQIPSGSLFELYEAAVQGVITRSFANEGTRDTASSMLRRIATTNHTRQERIFDAALVRQALQGHPDELDLWHEQLEGGNIPLVKILSFAPGHGKEDFTGEFQFKHLSFQEGLFVQSVRMGQAPFWTSDQSGAKALNTAFFKNVFTIGRGYIGDAVAKRHPQWNFGGLLESIGWSSLENALVMSTPVGLKADCTKASLNEVCKCLSTATTAKSLELKFGPNLASVEKLGASIQKAAALEELSLDFSGCKRLSALEQLGKGIASATKLKSMELDFSDCSLQDTAAAGVGGLLARGGALRKVSFRENRAFFSPSSISTMLEAMGNTELPLLEDVNLYDCDLTEADGPDIIRFLKNCGQLRRLNLGLNPRFLAKEGFAPLVEALGERGLQFVEEVSLEKCGLKAETSSGLATFLQRSEKLKKVSFRGNKGLFTSEGLSALLQDLGDKGQLGLEEMDMDDCDLQPEAAPALAKLLLRCPAVTRFTIPEGDEAAFIDGMVRGLGNDGVLRLERIELRHRMLKPEAASPLGALLRRCQQVVALDLSGNQKFFSALDALVGALGDSKLPLLEELALEDCVMGPDAAPALAKLLLRCPALKSFNIPSVEAAFLEGLVRGLGDSGFLDLQEINLRYRSIKPQAASALGSLLSRCRAPARPQPCAPTVASKSAKKTKRPAKQAVSQCRAENVLDLSGNTGFLTSEALDKLLRALGEPSLEDLNLDHCGLQPEAAPGLFALLRQCKKVTLSRNWDLFSPSSIDAMLNALPSEGLPLLEDISFCDCRLTSETASRLGALLQRCPKLKSVDFGGNPELFTSVGLAGLHEALGDGGLPSVEDVNLCGCALKPEVAAILFNFLRACSNLRCLNLAKNPDLFSSTSLPKVLDAFGENALPALQDLSFFGCRITEAAAPSVATMLLGFPALQSLDLRYGNPGITAVFAEFGDSAFPHLEKLQATQPEFDSPFLERVKFGTLKLCCPALQELDGQNFSEMEGFAVTDGGRDSDVPEEHLLDPMALRMVGCEENPRHAADAENGFVMEYCLQRRSVDDATKAAQSRESRRQAMESRASSAWERGVYDEGLHTGVVYESRRRTVEWALKIAADRDALWRSPLYPNSVSEALEEYESKRRTVEFAMRAAAEREARYDAMLEPNAEPPLRLRQVSDALEVYESKRRTVEFAARASAEREARYDAMLGAPQRFERRPTAATFEGCGEGKDGASAPAS